MKRLALKRKSIFLISFAVVFLDQISKDWATNNLTLEIPLPLIPRCIQLQLAKNTGSAFSLFSNSTQILGFLSLSVSIILVIWICRTSAISLLKGMALAFLLGGTIGNGIDRCG